MKYIIILFLLAILYSLGSALYYMMKKETSEQMVKALTLRIGLSIGLFVLLLVAYSFGWITPGNSIALPPQ